MTPSLIRFSLLPLLFISGLGAAELPRKAPLSRYESLSRNSPFTTPAKPAEGVPQKNPFEDWALKGIAPIASGYFITLINRKNPAEPVPPIDTDRPSEITIDRIERNPDKPLGTIVHLSKGAMKGTVTYDEKLSTIKPVAIKPGAHPPGQPQIPGQPAAQPNQPGQPGGVRQPRSRVVPPPTPGVAPAAPAAPATNPGTHGNPSRQRATHR